MLIDDLLKALGLDISQPHHNLTGWEDYRVYIFGDRVPKPPQEYTYVLYIEDGDWNYTINIECYTWDADKRIDRSPMDFYIDYRAIVEVYEDSPEFVEDLKRILAYYNKPGNPPDFPVDLIPKMTRVVELSDLYYGR